METSSSIPAPPQALPPPSQALAPLFSANQIGVAALIGTPLIGGVLWHMNRAALGQPRPWLGTVGGFAGLVVLGALAAAFPQFTFLPVVAAMSMRAGAAGTFPKDLVANAGRRSWALTLGAAVAACALFFGAIVAWAQLSVEPTLTLQHKGHTIAYFDEELRPEAESVVDALDAAGAFTEPDERFRFEGLDDEGALYVAIHYDVPMSAAAQRQRVDALAKILSTATQRCVQVRRAKPTALGAMLINEHVGAEARFCPP